MKTLVVGLGNPILGDDGIGWQVAKTLQDDKDILSEIEVICLSLGGISLMESLIGYKRVILIDSIITHQSPIGTVTCKNLDEFADPSFGHLSSAHDTSLQTAMKVGRELGIELPEEIIVVGIESRQVYDFSETLSPPVAAAIPIAVSMIKDLISQSIFKQTPGVRTTDH